MAAPHVAGVAALYLESAPTASPAGVAQVLRGSSVSNRVKNPNGSPNYLLQNRVAAPYEDPCLTTVCQKASGSLNENYYIYSPNGSYYRSAAGKQEVWLLATPTTDFDVELLQWTGSAWKLVFQAIGSTSNEHFTYNGTEGYYTLRISSAKGNGNYTLWSMHP
jgi:hypothetical protein